MALYDNPPQVDPATGRLPSYKQVLQQDPATGVYKIKYEYTPVNQRFAGLQSPAEILNQQLTTPVTTFPGLGTGTGDDSDDDTDDDGTGDDTGGGTGGGVQANLNQGGGRNEGYYDFQGGDNAFGVDNRSDLQKQLDTAFPTAFERLGTGLVGGLASQIPGIGPFVGTFGRGYMTTQRENAIADINQSIADGTFTAGYKTSEIAKALEDNSNLPDNVADYMRNVISMSNIQPVKRPTQTTQVGELPGITTPQDVGAPPSDIFGNLPGTSLGSNYGWNSQDGSTMTENSTTTNEDGTTTTNLSGIQTADAVLNEGTDGANNYNDTQVNNAQNTINGAVQEGGPAYGLEEGLSAIGYGYNPDTGNYAGTVGWSGGTVTTGYNPNIQNENYQNFFNQNPPDPSPVSTGGGGYSPNEGTTGPGGTAGPMGGTGQPGAGANTGANTGSSTSGSSSAGVGGGAGPQGGTGSPGDGANTGGPGGCFVKGTPIQMADGTTKEITTIKIGEETKGGIVQAKMEFMPQNIYNYKDVLVSGSHWVVEDNQLIAVEDSKHGVLTDRVEPVYTFKTSDNRIWINDIEFGDFETGTDKDWEPHFEMVRQDLNKKLRGEI